MSEQLTLIFDNTSYRTSQLPVQITWHEIKSDCKENGEIEPGDYIGNLVYGFSVCGTPIMFFIVIECRIMNHQMRPRFAAKCCQRCSLHISIGNRKLIFFDQITLDIIFSKSHFPTLCLVSQITSNVHKCFFNIFSKFKILIQDTT